MSKDQKLKLISDMIKSRFAIAESVDIQTMIFIAGVQTIGKPPSALSRDQKMDLMHVGTCAILEPYGYYRLTERDQDNWPVYEKLKEIDLPEDNTDELIKDALISYFGV